jgi:hypothetical protein
LLICSDLAMRFMLSTRYTAQTVIAIIIAATIGIKK